MEYDRADKEVAEMSKIKVNEQRAVDEFQELTAIDAPSFGERQMADRLIVKLKELGFEVEEDNAGKHFGGNAGNLYAYLPGPILFKVEATAVKFVVRLKLSTLIKRVETSRMKK